MTLPVIANRLLDRQAVRPEPQSLGGAKLHPEDELEAILGIRIRVEYMCSVRMCGCRLPLHPLKWPAVNEDLHAGHISSEPPVRWRLWPSPPQCCCNTTEKGSYWSNWLTTEESGGCVRKRSQNTQIICTNTFAFCHQATVQVFKSNQLDGNECKPWQELFYFPASSMQIQGIPLPHFTDGHRKPLK